MFLATALRRIARGTLASLSRGAFFAFIVVWDIALVLVNLVAFKRKVGHVTPKGHPGAGGVWPEYIPPRAGDSRCACPALNAMSNHGILPRNGRNIPFRELPGKVRATYNFSPTFSLFVPRYMASILGRSFSKDTLNLSDIDVHNGIEHDASLTREDTYHAKSQALPLPALVAALLRSATGPPQPGHTLAEDELAGSESKSGKDTPELEGPPYADRRREARATNPQYSQSFNAKMFGTSNASGLTTIFGGRMDDIRVFLAEERLPAGWESRVREPMGLTFGAFNVTAIRVELGIEEEVRGPAVP
ncbi:chloroperoxidase-like protein [Auriscalpium vulgare]|uniref:Chloroperoxidase-like protein n=1 Tax=Auriscalpium vulgare TaxID=40419 RepID=A0ACB8RRR0_9AGAM|nr:chloroperoxidase-like protein [Auriscalpium vulgare]